MQRVGARAAGRSARARFDRRDAVEFPDAARRAAAPATSPAIERSRTTTSRWATSRNPSTTRSRKKSRPPSSECSEGHEAQARATILASRKRHGYPTEPLSECECEEIDDEARRSLGVDVARAARTICMRESSASGSSARNASMRALTASAGSREAHDLHAGDARRGVDERPAGAGGDFVARETPVSSCNSRVALAVQIDAAAEDIFADRACRRGNRSCRRWRCAPPFRRAGRRRRAPGARPSRSSCRRRGRESQNRARRERRHSRSRNMRRAGRRAVAPRLERVAAQQQHAAVEQARLRRLVAPANARRSSPPRLARRAMAVAPAGDRAPRLRRCATRSQIERSLSAISTAEPPIVAERSAPFSTSRPSDDRARAAHLDALLDDQRVLAVARPVEVA